jgi:hypothetical protein
MKSLLLAILFLILAIVVAGAIALGVTNLGVDRTATKNQTVYGTVKAIVVKPGRGDVELVPSDKLIRVREQRHYVIKQPTLQTTRSGGVLTIEPKCDDTYPDVVPCFSNLRITVPAGVKVTIDGKGGDVDARSVDLRAAHVETGSGHIDLSLVGHPGLLWAHSDSGDIEIVAAGARGVDAQSDSGDVHVDVAAKPRKVLARSNSGDIELAVPRGIYAIKARSSSGDVRARGLSRNAASASSIDARTDSGDISLHPR